MQGMEKQKKTIAYLIQLLYYQMTFWGLCTILVPLAAGFHTRLYIVNWIIASFVPFLLYVLRERLAKAYQFLLSHFIIGLLLLILPQPGIAMRIFYAVGIVVLLVLSFKRKLTGEKPATEPMGQMIALVFGTLSLLMLNHMGYGSQGIYIGSCLVVVFCEYILHQFLVRYQNFIFFSKDSADHVAEKAIFKNGLLRTIGMMVLTAFSMLSIFYMRLWQKLFLFIRQMLVKLLRFLFSLLPEAKPQVEEAAQEIVQETGSGAGFPETPGETWIGWEIIWTMISVLMIAAAVFLLVRGIYALVKFFIAAFGAKRAKEERIQTDEVEEVHESLQRKQEEKEEKMSLWDRYLSPEGKVRRMYKLYVSKLRETKGESRSKRKEGVLLSADEGITDRYLQSLTPWEACSLREKVRPLGITEESLQEFCDIYEYTRYSGGKTSQQQVTQMKKCLEK